LFAYTLHSFIIAHYCFTGRSFLTQYAPVLNWNTTTALHSCTHAAPATHPAHTRCPPLPRRSFLTQYAAVLNWNTTTALLESYGRLEELEVFAGAKGDQEALLEYLMRNPDGAKR
jgi:hypothetical protein